LAAALAGGCAHGPALRCPHQAGPEWRRYQSPHFAVTTDLRPSRARHLVAELERTYHDFVDVTGWHFPGRGEPPGRMRVVVFSRRADYDAVAPPRTDGFFRPDTLEAESAVVVDNDGSHPVGEVLLHELTHRLLRYYVPNTPLGLNEGLAEFFSTFHVTDGVAHNGTPPREALMVPKDGSKLQFPSLATLWTLDTLEGMSPREVHCFYVGAWFMVVAMAQFDNHRLADLLSRMADGESFKSAVDESYGDAGSMLNTLYLITINSMYQFGPRVIPAFTKPYRSAAIDVPIDDGAPLDEGALHLLWADLQLGRYDVAPEVALAQAHGSESAQLSYMRGLLHMQRDERDAALRDFTAAVDARPDVERYHLTLARMYLLGPDRDRAERLAAVAPQMVWLAGHAETALSLAVVAMYDALRGDKDTAEARVKRALAIDPTSALAYLAAAIVAASRGNVDAAIAAAERSQRLTPEGGSDAAAKQLLAELRRMPHLPERMKLQPPSLSRPPRR
jgi:tetratricopeptide (TPR) repeat protein